MRSISFDVLEKKTREAGSKVPNYKRNSPSCREITSNNTVPGDVCESFEAV
jgi:regulator of cell morphogenesis and NO signaling